MAQNREKFGDWFLIENYQQTKGLTEQDCLTEPVTAKTYAMMYDEEWKKTQVNVGSMSEEFMKKGNLRLAEGRMPKSANEIVCDYNTLSKLGYSAELGQEIKFNYYLNNNTSSSEHPQRNAPYVLCGVLENFTDSWSVMRYIPGALLSEEGCKRLTATGYTVYMYGLKDSFRTDNYESLYKTLSSFNSKKVFFNTDVYDFQPWGPKAIYNYIYLLVMVIGIAALTYQIISYQHSRTEHYRKLFRMGTTKLSVLGCRTMENILILIPSGILGILTVYFTGFLIGKNLQVRTGVAFYHVNMEVTLKSILSLMVALFVAELVNVFMTYCSRMDSVGGRIQRKNGDTKPEHAGSIQQDIEEKTDGLNAQDNKRQSREEQKYKEKLKYNNVTWEMHKRLSRSNGMAMRIGIRVFSIAILAVIIFCFINIYDAVSVYKKYESKSDISGFQTQDGTTQNYVNVTYDATSNEHNTYPKGTLEYYMVYKRPMYNKEEYLEFQHKLAEGERDKSIAGIRDLDAGLFQIGIGNSYCKMGNSTIIQGMDDTFRDTMESTAGVESAQYSAFETARDWDWDTMDLSKMGVGKMTLSGTQLPVYSDTYLYATEYVDPTEQIYDRISQYIDPSQIDYEAFRSGSQVVVFEQKNVSQSYDNTIQVGTDINFHYYKLPIAMKYVDWKSYNLDFSQYVESPFPYWNQFAELYYNRNALMTTRFDTANMGYFYTYYPGVVTERSDELMSMYYKMMFEPCVTSKVAAVVRVTDEIKDELRDIIPDFGYYTAFASSELGKQACDKQNELMQEVLGDDYTDELKCEYTYNQITMTYNLSASYSATDNIVSAYFSANNVIYQSAASEKEEYRTNALNAILQYGITMIAAMIINILIYAILTRNRLELRKKKLQLLARLGTTKSQIRRVCMLEILRESLWCIFTAPLQLLVQYVICRRNIRKL